MQQGLKTLAACEGESLYFPLRSVVGEDAVCDELTGFERIKPVPSELHPDLVNVGWMDRVKTGKAKASTSYLEALRVEASAGQIPESLLGFDKYSTPKMTSAEEKSAFKFGLDKRPKHQHSQVKMVEVAKQLAPKFQSKLPGYKFKTVKFEDLPNIVAFNIELLKKDSSPGVPYMHVAKQNKLLINEMQPFLVSATVDRIEARVSKVRSGELKKLTTVEEIMWAYDEGLIDPIRVLEKNEIYEYQRKEPRTICSVSVIDSLCERVLHSKDYEKSIGFWNKSFQTIGLRLGDVGAMQSLWEHIHSFVSDKRTVLSSDVKSFEFGVSSEAIEAHYEVESYRLFGVQIKDLDLSNDWAALFYSEFLLSVSGSLYMFSDGQVVVDLKPRIISGSYKTSSMGSKIRAIMSCTVASLISGTVVWNESATNGDDAVEAVLRDVPDEDITKHYWEIGFKVTDLHRSDNTFNLCSQVLNQFTHYPESVLKTTVTLLYNKEITNELLEQYEFVNERFPGWGSLRPFVFDLVTRVNEKTKEQSSVGL